MFGDYEVFRHGQYDIALCCGLEGYAFLFRDGQMYQVQWKRDSTGVVTLLNPDGTPFAFKPGPTWFEVIGLNSTLAQDGQIFRFKHVMP